MSSKPELKILEEEFIEALEENEHLLPDTIKKIFKSFQELGEFHQEMQCSESITTGNLESLVKDARKNILSVISGLCVKTEPKRIPELVQLGAKKMLLNMELSEFLIEQKYGGAKKRAVDILRLVGGITRVQDLVRLTKYEVLQIRGIGKKCYEVIEDSLVAYGLSLQPVDACKNMPINKLQIEGDPSEVARIIYTLETYYNIKTVAGLRRLQKNYAIYIELGSKKRNLLDKALERIGFPTPKRREI